MLDVGSFEEAGLVLQRVPGFGLFEVFLLFDSGYAFLFCWGFFSVLFFVSFCFFAGMSQEAAVLICPILDAADFGDLGKVAPAAQIVRCGSHARIATVFCGEVL